VVIFEDEFYGLELGLIYTTHDDCDCITRRTVIKNYSSKSVVLEKIMSLQLDLPEKDYFLDTFDGIWARERHKNTKELISGIYVNESTTGSSSNRHNPFIMLHKSNCDEKQGECIGINLIYSGNHYEAVEVTGYEKIRIMAGINPFGFTWEIGAMEKFYSPEAVISYSFLGSNLF
jgi:alpha-galactosidase